MVRCRERNGTTELCSKISYCRPVPQESHQIPPRSDWACAGYTDRSDVSRSVPPLGPPLILISRKPQPIFMPLLALSSRPPSQPQSSDPAGGNVNPTGGTDWGPPPPAPDQNTGWKLFRPYPCPRLIATPWRSP